VSTADGTVVGPTQVVDNGPRSQRWNLVVGFGGIGVYVALSEEAAASKGSRG
jgi:hypothetical protein